MKNKDIAKILKTFHKVIYRRMSPLRRVSLELEYLSKITTLLAILAYISERKVNLSFLAKNARLVAEGFFNFFIERDFNYVRNDNTLFMISFLEKLLLQSFPSMTLTSRQISVVFKSFWDMKSMINNIETMNQNKNQSAGSIQRVNELRMECINNINLVADIIKNIDNYHYNQIYLLLWKMKVIKRHY